MAISESMVHNSRIPLHGRGKLSTEDQRQGSIANGNVLRIRLLDCDTSCAIMKYLEWDEDIILGLLK